VLINGFSGAIKCKKERLTNTIVILNVRSANQPPAAFGCQPPALCTQCIRTVLRTASIELINAHSTISTGHVPGFPPGLSCRLPL
jgi:hypothetical protein